MAIPDYQTIMLPLLKYVGDKKEHSLRQVIDAIANQFHLTAEERRELLPSGHQSIINNRVGWACTYMKKAGLISSPQRGYLSITERGSDVLRQKPSKIDLEFLGQFEEFIAFRTFKREKRTIETTEEEGERTPEETLESAYQNLRINLANDLLQKIKASPPSLFENIVVDLLVAMGYGGNRKDAGAAIGKSGDEGIDGIIKEDPLGLDIIYIQAKRWEGTVGRREIQAFAGSLQGKHARKGIFIATANYSKEAQEFASNIENKIILIDGDQLTQLMIDHNVGISTSTTYETKKIDLDYFTEE